MGGVVLGSFFIVDEKLLEFDFGWWLRLIDVVIIQGVIVYVRFYEGVVVNLFYGWKI